MGQERMAAIAIPISIVVGLLLYVLRSRCRFLYGLLELVAALAVIVLTFFPQTYALLIQNPPVWGSVLSTGAGVLAGIYVMIRALDNIHAGLRPEWRAKWERVFFNMKDGEIDKNNQQKPDASSCLIVSKIIVPFVWLYRLTPIAKFTGVLCIIGAFQAWAFMQTERAFVFPSSVTFVGLATDEISQPIILDVELTNYGRDLATINRLIAFVTTDLLTAEPNYDAPGRVERAYPPVPTNGKIGENLNFFNWGKATAEQVRDGALPFHIFGQLVYIDDFFWRRTSDFCYVYVANKADPSRAVFRNCPEPNYTKTQ
jgi:hypothetical protein